MSDPLQRYQRAFQNMSVDEVLNNRRAIIGPANMPTDAQGQLAKDALRALNDGVEPTPVQLAALETVVRLMRPSQLSVNREFENIPDEAAGLGDWKAFGTTVKSALYTIGRVDNSVDKGLGTGFLVSEKLLVTNIHVLDDLTGGLRRLERGQAKVWFKKEFGAVPEEAAVAIVRVAALHDTLDLAILEIDPVSLSDDRVPLTISAGNPTAGEAVVVIGYPQNDPLRNPLFIPAIFGGRFGVKRAAPGEIVSTTGKSLFHDCSTLGGNSGSPVLSLSSGKLVGVHRAGSFMYRNESVRGSDLQSFVQANL
ncbi:MAG: serine protease [Planctomycetaceae bacterium]